MNNNIWKDGIMGLVVGDALGLPVQFRTREEVKANPVTKMEGYGTFNLPKGSWSDDSSLAIATLESIIRNNTIVVEDVMDNFVKWLYEGIFTPYGQAYDIGETCRYAIEKYKTERNVDICGKVGERANGNGGLMRIMPVCLFAYENEKKGKCTEEDAIAIVHKLTSVTHNHKRVCIASGMYYFMVKAILEHNGEFIEVLQFGIDNSMKYYGKDSDNYEELGYYRRLFCLKEFANTKEDEIRNTGYVLDSLEAAVWCLINTDSYKGCLLKAVNHGSDTDTVGAIAGGLAGLFYGYDLIPNEWLGDIVKRDWIEALCDKRFNSMDE